MSSNSDSEIFTFEDNIFLQTTTEDDLQSLGFAAVTWCGKINGTPMEESISFDYMYHSVDYRKA
jgi:hypothetical protein